jgi:hypothetical protein
MATREKLQGLSDTDRALGYALAISILQSAECQLAIRWIRRAHLVPRRCWKTCSTKRVRLAMLESTGIAVSEEAMVMALASSGFSARIIGGEESTNVGIRCLPRGGQIVDMSGPDA